jgi:HicA toxin of bacterial toxin-antitoxin,
MASNYAAAVRRILIAAGCRFDRHGKGDHEIWLCPKSRRPVVVDGNIRSRHTANGILKQAGLPPEF